MITAVHAIVSTSDPDATRAFFRPAAPTSSSRCRLICDDLRFTISELTAKGAQFAGDIEQASGGSIARLLVPGAAAMTLYQGMYDPPATAQ